jgi:tRNA(Ile)-lysidine synthase
VTRNAPLTGKQDLSAEFKNLVEKFAANLPPQLWQDVHVAVALSGGPDSVALLRAAVELKQLFGGKGEIFALHVNHHLRGEESDADAEWCVQLCHELRVPLQVLHGNVAAQAATDGDGLEAAAREQRYALLTEAAEAHGARYLFMAHTRDDQIETVLFRLLRGTGLRGLAGITPNRPLTPALTVVRPLLVCTRNEVLEYLTSLGQDSRTDSSNADRAFMRNRIRTELLPLLRAEYNTGADEALLRLSAQARELYHFVDLQARELWGTAREQVGPAQFAVRLADLSGASSMLVSEMLRIAWREVGLAEQDMTHDWWTQLAGLALGYVSASTLNLPGNVRAEVRENVLVIERGGQ